MDYTDIFSVVETPPSHEVKVTLTDQRTNNDTIFRHYVDGSIGELDIANIWLFGKMRNPLERSKLLYQDKSLWTSEDCIRMVTLKLTKTKYRSSCRLSSEQQIKAFYNSDEWEYVRKKKLALNPFCEVCQQNKIVTPAKIVHHTISIRNNWELRLTLSNLQSICIPCHNSHHQTKFNTAIHETEIVLVLGPPASGKTTYVKDNKQYDDIVFDLDTLIQALTYNDVYVKSNVAFRIALELRETIIKACIGKCRRLWVISSEPVLSKAKELLPRSPNRIVCLGRNKQRVKAQLMADPGRTGQVDWLSIIDQWYAEQDVFKAEVE